MSPADIQLVWNTLWGISIGLTVAGVIAAVLVRSFLTGYLDAKGRSLATKEDVQQVLDQVRRSESIKANVVQMNWLRQQHWANREKHYLNLLSSLTKFEISLRDRLDYYIEPSSEHDQEPQGEHFKALNTQGSEAMMSMRELIGPASVFLSKATVQAVAALIQHHWDVAEFSSHTEEYLRESLSHVQTAFAAVLSEAKASLAEAESAA